VIEEGKKILMKTLEQFRAREKDVGMDLSAALMGARMEANRIGPCPKCGQDLRKIQSKFGKQFVGCSGYPECKQTYALPQMALIEATGENCPKCGTPMVKVIRRGARPFDLCLELSCKSDFDKSESSVRMESEVKADMNKPKVISPPSTFTPAPKPFAPSAFKPAPKPFVTSPIASAKPAFFKGTGAGQMPPEIKVSEKKAPVKKAAVKPKTTTDKPKGRGKSKKEF
jgi:DNA topoisomerase-1